MTLADVRLGALAVGVNLVVIVLAATGRGYVALLLAVVVPCLLVFDWPSIFRLDARRTALLLAANVLVVAALLLGLGPLALAVSVLVPVGFVVARRPQVGLLVLLALTPFDGLLAILPVPAFVDYWKEALVVGVLLATFVAPADARGDPGRPWPSWHVGVIGLLGVAALSAATVDPVQAIVGWKISFFYLAALVAVWRCPLSRAERDRLVSILMTVGFLTAVIGLGQQVLGPSRLNALGYEYNSTIRFAGGFMRSFSTFIQPFGFGFFLMVVLLVGIPVALADTGRRRNRLFLGLLPIYALAIMSTIVRGAWLGLLLGLVYLGAQRFRILLIGIPLALVVLVVVPPEAIDTALSSSSSVERAEGWRENLDRVIDRPLGEGIGSTGSAALAVVRLGGKANTYQTDNYYFKIVLELGVLGLWLLVISLLAVFGQQRRLGRRLPGSDGALAAGVSATTLGSAAACFVASYFDIFPLDFLYWFLAGVVATLPATTEPRTFSSTDPLLEAQRTSDASVALAASE